MSLSIAGAVVRPVLWFLVRLPVLILILGMSLVMSSCTMLGMNYASLETDNKPAPRPEIDVPAIISDDAYRARLMSDFEDVLYGPWPAGLPVSWGEARIVEANLLDGRGVLEEIPVTVGRGDGASTFFLVVAYPEGDGPFPLVISQTFADNCSVFPDSPVTAPEGGLCDGSRMTGAVGFLATQIFGTYIAKAPLERYLDAGIAYASFYGSDFVPDSRRAGPEVMAQLGGPVLPTSTLMAWAYGYSAAIDALEGDSRIDRDAIATLGHSRFGKSAIIAGIWDRRIDAVIAHQSGFAGASLSRSEVGEGLARMAKTYPHWLAPQAQDWLDRLDDIPVDQHQLLALLAPTPVLLGNGRRDVWSDPNSSYRAAQAASRVYEALGAGGLPAGGMRKVDVSANLAWWMRPGGHSVVSEDIDTFIAFMNAHAAPAHRGGNAVQTTGCELASPENTC